jgi:hypothetical protein
MPAGLHRTYGAHHLHFITCSCYRRLPFLGTPRSRNGFLSILEQTRQRYRFVVVGYVLMPEHFHLLITEPEVGNPWSKRPSHPSPAFILGSDDFKSRANQPALMHVQRLELLQPAP